MLWRQHGGMPERTKGSDCKAENRRRSKSCRQLQTNTTAVDHLARASGFGSGGWRFITAQAVNTAMASITFEYESRRWFDPRRGTSITYLPL